MKSPLQILCASATLALGCAEEIPPAPEAPAGYRSLPEKVNALGAAVLGDHLHVLGGHVGAAHDSSIDNFLSAFRRLPLGDARAAWQDLRALGPPLQQAALFVHEGRLYRLGGLTAKHRKDQPKDLYTTETFSVCDSGADRWQDPKPMPDTRSSHSVVAVGSVLTVKPAVSAAYDSRSSRLTKTRPRGFSWQARRAAASCKASDERSTYRVMSTGAAACVDAAVAVRGPARLPAPAPTSVGGERDLSQGVSSIPPAAADCRR